MDFMCFPKTQGLINKAPSLPSEDDLLQTGSLHNPAYLEITFTYWQRWFVQVLQTSSPDDQEE